MAARVFNAHSRELIEAADALKGTGNGFKVRLSFVGRNNKNASGFSDKFYEVGMTPIGEWYARWGKNGAKGQTRRLWSKWEAHNIIFEKRAKGYRNVHPAKTFAIESEVWVELRKAA